jgi:hypothetical protein
VKTPLRAVSDGFTLVELTVVMMLTLAFSGIVLNFAIDFWGNTTSLQNDSETFVTRQDAGDRLRDILNVASQLNTQNGIPDANTNNVDPADLTGTYWQIQHAIPGNTPLPAAGSTTPLVYFSAPSVDESKNFIMNGVQPYQDEFVLYLDGTTKRLMLRSLANPGASGNRVTTSCPPAVATAACPADRRIAIDVESVDMRFFSRSGNLLDWTSVTDPITGNYIGPDYPVVEVIELTINLERKAIVKGAADSRNQTIVRVALRNG